MELGEDLAGCWVSLTGSWWCRPGAGSEDSSAYPPVLAEFRPGDGVDASWPVTPAIYFGGGKPSSTPINTSSCWSGTTACPELRRHEHSCAPRLIDQ